MTARPIIIAGNHYPSRAVVENRLRQILHAGDENDEVTTIEDVTLLSALFFARESKVAELEGRIIIGWGRERNAANICFAALCGDGSRLHFGIKNCLNALYAKQGKK